MPTAHRTSTRLSHSKLKMLAWQLNNQLPLIGNWLRYNALDSLLTYACSGNSDAAEILFKMGVRSSDPRILQACTTLLSRKLPQRTINIAWQLWLNSRSKWLEVSLTHQEKPATHPLPVRVFSLLKLGPKFSDRLHRLPPGGMAALVHALDDPDEDIRHRAELTIPKLSGVESINELSSIWMRSRRSDLLALLVKASIKPTKLPEAAFLALHGQFYDRLSDAPPEWLKVICLGLCDSDELLSSQSARVLRHLQREETIQMLCQTWQMARVPELESAILDARYLPMHPLDTRILIALLTNRVDICRDVPPMGVRFLVSALLDSNQQISSLARDALLHLSNPNSSEMVFQLFIESGNPDLISIIHTANYIPADNGMQALFYFLTEQWSQYDTIDFDHRLLQSAYRSAPAELRQRIARLIQGTGKQDYLDILNQPLPSSASFESEEAELWIKIYASHGDWQQLWNRSIEVPYPKSVQIMQLLQNSGWSPSSETERSVFNRLCELSNLVLVSSSDIQKSLPCAYPVEYLNVRSRVNAVAFSPNSPHVAMATGNRKIILWDYQRGCLMRVVSGFAHTIGNLVFLPNGTLLAAERSNRRVPCAIYLYDGEKIQTIGNHDSSITDIIFMSPDLLFASSRDNKLNLWNIYERRLVQSRQLHDWARRITYQPVGNILVACHRYSEILDASLFSSPAMLINHHARTSAPASTVRVITAVPEQKSLIIGENNGNVTRLDVDISLKIAQFMPLYHHDSAVTGMTWRKSPELSLLTSSAEGKIIHYNWIQQVQSSYASSTTDRLTSLVISPDERYLATGTTNGNMILWDLAPLDLPEIYRKPLMHCSVQMLQELTDLSRVGQLSSEIRLVVEFLLLQLRRCFQYDIEMEEFQGIAPGTYDILVE